MNTAELIDLLCTDAYLPAQLNSTCFSGEHYKIEYAVYHHKMIHALKGISLDEGCAVEPLMLLVDLLRERWDSLCGTDDSYTLTNQNKLNALCIAVADFVASQLNQSFYKILMPSLLTWGVVGLSENRYQAPQESLTSFFITADAKHLVLLEDILGYSASSFHLTLPNEPDNPRLTAYNTSLLLKQFPTCQEYNKLLQEKVKIIEKGVVLAHQIEQLIAGLRNGGAKKFGSEYNAGAQANIAILNFNAVVNALPQGLRATLFELKTDKDENFGTYWRRLTNPLSYQDSVYCVELIADRLGSILMKHRAYLETVFIKEGDVTSEYIKHLDQRLAAKRQDSIIPLKKHQHLESAVHNRKALPAHWIPMPLYRYRLKDVAASGDIKLAQLFLEYGLIEDLMNGQALFQAYLNKQYEMLSVLLVHPGADVNAINEEGDTLLLCAVSNRQIKTVKLLLRHPDIQVNHLGFARSQTGKQEYTALYVAIDVGNSVDIEIITELLKCEYIDVNKRMIETDASGRKTTRPLLVHAIERSSLEAIRLLLSREDINVNALSTANNKYPFLLALELKNQPIIALLLQHKRLRVRPKDLELALVFEDSNVALSILSHPTAKYLDVNARCDNEETFLSIALKKKKLDLIDALLAREDINVNLNPRFGGSIMDLAEQVGDDMATLSKIVERKKRGRDVENLFKWFQNPANAGKKLDLMEHPAHTSKKMRVC